MRRPNSRQARPAVERLETRQLLRGQAVIHGQKVNDKDLLRVETQILNDSPLSDRRIEYTTPQGTKVVLTLFGLGSLAGTTVRAGGALDLVYTNTNSSSQIVARTSGGTGQAALATLHDADSPLSDISGVGSHVIGSVKLPNFNLINNGTINLAAGVGLLQLNSIGANTQLELRSLPAPSNTIYPSETPVESLSFSSTPTGGTILTSVNGYTFPGTSGATVAVGGTSSTSASSATSTSSSFNNGLSSGLSGGFSNGLSTGTSGGFSNGLSVGSNPSGTNVVTGATSSTTTASSAGGAATAGFTLPGALAGFKVLTEPFPPVGIRLLINHVIGQSHGGSPIGDPQVFGYDSTANALIRFDATTGSALQSIPMATIAGPVTAMNLGRNGGELVALVASGPSANEIIQAFDVTTGAFVGQFSTANLAGTINNVNGIALTDSRTFLTDSSIPSPTGSGVGRGQVINLTASLAKGQAVPVGSPFVPSRDLQLLNGATGLAGSPTAYLPILAHFDSFAPDKVQFGISGVLTSGTPRETQRTQVTSPASITPGGPPPPANFPPGAPTPIALGSIDQNLALVTGVFGGQNTVALYTPQTLASQGTIALNDPNQLSALSQSFHPEIAGSALINVHGVLNRIQSQDIHGLVLNDIGFLNLINAGTATDSAFIGLPVNHVNIKRRSNVLILSSPRPVDGRGGITIVPNLKPQGPLIRPSVP